MGNALRKHCNACAGSAAGENYHLDGIAVRWADMSVTLEAEVRRKLRISRKVNFLVVGLGGVGKSTLLTSLRMCLTHKTGEEVGTAGVFPGGESATLRLRRHEIITPELDQDFYHYTPVAFDMPGMLNMNNDVIRSTYKCVLQGRMPIGEHFLAIREEDVDEKFHMKNENKIDRVIFVHSCKLEIPENLINALKSVCSQLNIALFSVLSHTDLDKTDHVCTQEDLDRVIGVFGSPRGCAVELYHRVGDGNLESVPQTDYYLLSLWKELLDISYPIHSTYS